MGGVESARADREYDTEIKILGLTVLFLLSFDNMIVYTTYIYILYLRYFLIFGGG